MEIIEELKIYGLSEKEAKVYLALIKLGRGTVNALAEKADLVRTTTYDILKSLREKSLVSSADINNVLYFESSSPDELTNRLDEKKERIKKIIPELKKIKEVQPIRPEVQLFEGKEGVKTVFKEILREAKPTIAIANNKQMVKLIPYFAHYFIKQRATKKIPLRIICEPSQFSKTMLKNKDTKEYRKTRTLESCNGIFLNEYVFGDKVAILDSEADEPVGILITHKEFAKTQRILLEETWKNSKK